VLRFGTRAHWRCHSRFEVRFSFCLAPQRRHVSAYSKCMVLSYLKMLCATNRSNIFTVDICKVVSLQKLEPVLLVLCFWLCSDEEFSAEQLLLSKREQVLLFLFHFKNNDPQRVISKLFCVSKRTVGRCVDRVRNCLTRDFVKLHYGFGPEHTVSCDDGVRRPFRRISC